MNHPFVYVGCFVPFRELMDKVDSIREEQLFRTIAAPHVTFAYRPQTVNEALFGEKVEITIIGYGNDGQNEGLEVTLSTDNPELREMIKQIEVPHITLSVSETGESVNTRYLSFEPVEPISITGRFGGFVNESMVITN